jgi:hypothetical protein
MTSIERVTVTIAADLVSGIDRLEKNRSKFIAEAVRREIDRRRRAALAISLANPHTESQNPDLSESGFDEWANYLPAEDAASLVDPAAGTPIQWVQGAGWARRAAKPAKQVRAGRTTSKTREAKR